MLTRLFVDNYKALVNFELALPRTSLFLGLNGSGKTSVFEIVGLLRRMMRGETLRIHADTLTRWQTRDVQRFELDATIQAQSYRYVLEVVHLPEEGGCRIQSERLTGGSDQLLFESDSGGAQLFRDDGSKGPEVLADRTRSSLPIVAGRRDNKLLTRFVDWLIRDVFVCGVNPAVMTDVSEASANLLTGDLHNFADWWRHVHEESSDAAESLRRFLEETIQGFRGLEFRTISHKAKRLMVRIGDLSYGFDELSDGQRVLIALHALLVYARNRPITLLLDEPDNFVSVREIQPFYNALVAGDQTQAVLISHHPHLTDLIAASHGILFSRGANAPVRVEPFRGPEGTGLTASELFAKGFFDELA